MACAISFLNNKGCHSGADPAQPLKLSCRSRIDIHCVRRSRHTCHDSHGASLFANHSR